MLSARDFKNVLDESAASYCFDMALKETVDSTFRSQMGTTTYY
jgi:hypothetical protein